MFESMDSCLQADIIMETLTVSTSNQLDILVNPTEKEHVDLLQALLDLKIDGVEVKKGQKQPFVIQKVMHISILFGKLKEPPEEFNDWLLKVYEMKLRIQIGFWSTGNWLRSEYKKISVETQTEEGIAELISFLDCDFSNDTKVSWSPYGHIKGRQWSFEIVKMFAPTVEKIWLRHFPSVILLEKIPLTRISLRLNENSMEVLVTDRCQQLYIEKLLDTYPDLVMSDSSVVQLHRWHLIKYSTKIQSSLIVNLEHWRIKYVVLGYIRQKIIVNTEEEALQLNQFLYGYSLINEPIVTDVSEPLKKQFVVMVPEEDATMVLGSFEEDGFVELEQYAAPVVIAAVGSVAVAVATNAESIGNGITKVINAAADAGKKIIDSISNVFHFFGWRSNLYRLMEVPKTKQVESLLHPGFFESFMKLAYISKGIISLYKFEEPYTPVVPVCVIPKTEVEVKNLRKLVSDRTSLGVKSLNETAININEPETLIVSKEFLWQTIFCHFLHFGTDHMYSKFVVLHANQEQSFLLHNLLTYYSKTHKILYGNHFEPRDLKLIALPMSDLLGEKLITVFNEHEIEWELLSPRYVYPSLRYSYEVKMTFDNNEQKDQFKTSADQLKKMFKVKICQTNRLEVCGTFVHPFVKFIESNYPKLNVDVQEIINYTVPEPALTEISPGLPAEPGTVGMAGFGGDPMTIFKNLGKVSYALDVVFVDSEEILEKINQINELKKIKIMEQKKLKVGDYVHLQISKEHFFDVYHEFSHHDCLLHLTNTVNFFFALTQTNIGEKLDEILCKYHSLLGLIIDQPSLTFGHLIKISAPVVSAQAFANILDIAGIPFHLEGESVKAVPQAHDVLVEVKPDDLHIPCNDSYQSPSKKNQNTHPIGISITPMNLQEVKVLKSVISPLLKGNKFVPQYKEYWFNRIPMPFVYKSDYVSFEHFHNVISLLLSYGICGWRLRYDASFLCYVTPVTEEQIQILTDLVVEHGGHTVVSVKSFGFLQSGVHPLIFPLGKVTHFIEQCKNYGIVSQVEGLLKQTERLMMIRVQPNDMQKVNYLNNLVADKYNKEHGLMINTDIRLNEPVVLAYPITDIDFGMKLIKYFAEQNIRFDTLIPNYLHPILRYDHKIQIKLFSESQAAFYNQLITGNFISKYKLLVEGDLKLHTTVEVWFPECYIEVFPNVISTTFPQLHFNTMKTKFTSILMREKIKKIYLFMKSDCMINIIKELAEENQVTVDLKSLKQNVWTLLHTAKCPLCFPLCHILPTTTNLKNELLTPTVPIPVCFPLTVRITIPVTYRNELDKFEASIQENQLTHIYSKSECTFMLPVKYIDFFEHYMKKNRIPYKGVPKIHYQTQFENAPNILYIEPRTQSDVEKLYQYITPKIKDLQLQVSNHGHWAVQLLTCISLQTWEHYSTLQELIKQHEIFVCYNTPSYCEIFCTVQVRSHVDKINELIEHQGRDYEVQTTDAECVHVGSTIVLRLTEKSVSKLVAILQECKIPYIVPVKKPSIILPKMFRFSPGSEKEIEVISHLARKENVDLWILGNLQVDEPSLIAVSPEYVEMFVGTLQKMGVKITEVDNE